MPNVSVQKHTRHKHAHLATAGGAVVGLVVILAVWGFQLTKTFSGEQLDRVGDDLSKTYGEFREGMDETAVYRDLLNKQYQEVQAELDADLAAPEEEMSVSNIAEEKAFNAVASQLLLKMSGLGGTDGSQEATPADEVATEEEVSASISQGEGASSDQAPLGQVAGEQDINGGIESE